jgi:DNA topoisomerase IA
MEKAAYAIARIKRGERRRKPAAPFITSTLQQEASRRLGYTARRTMALAQQLYEGLDLGEGGTTGLITYMRTDSTNVAEVAQKEARQFIAIPTAATTCPKRRPSIARGRSARKKRTKPSGRLRCCACPKRSRRT